MIHIGNEELRPRGYRKITDHFLTKELKLKMYCKAKAMLQRHTHSGHRQILLANEKSFDTEEPFNHQSDHANARRITQEAKEK
ncbi:hypothetical protein TNCV_3054801 [Trichonephila clavipes]|nr:hypothetical protein TNCV_3054801 [Trichonephila clavipes]